MKESIYKYFDLGILQWMSYPGQDPMQSLRTICRDPFFTLIETAGFGGGEQTAAARALLDQSHLTVLGAAHPVMLGRGLNPNALAEEERRAAEDYLLQLVDESAALGARGLSFLAGKYEEEHREEAFAALLKTTKNVCRAAKEKGLMVEIEVFDYDVDKCSLIGPAPLAARFCEAVREEYDNFGLLVDLSHIPIIHETIEYSVHTLRCCITHLHYGNAVIRPGFDAYGDKHPRMGYPHSENDVPELVEFLRVLRREGLFRPDAPLPLSCEVTPRPGEDPDIVVANTKRCLTRAWALLED